MRRQEQQAADDGHVLQQVVELVLERRRIGRPGDALRCAAGAIETPIDI